jgi:hypothetical protein
MNGVYFVSLFRAYFLLCVPVQDDEFYEGMGVYFVSLASNLGYGLMLQALYTDCIHSSQKADSKSGIECRRSIDGK